MNKPSVNVSVRLLSSEPDTEVSLDEAVKKYFCLIPKPGPLPRYGIL